MFKAKCIEVLPYDPEGHESDPNDVPVGKIL